MAIVLVTGQAAFVAGEGEGRGEQEEENCRVFHLFRIENIYNRIDCLISKSEPTPEKRIYNQSSQKSTKGKNGRRGKALLGRSPQSSQLHLIR